MKTWREFSGRAPSRSPPSTFPDDLGRLLHENCLTLGNKPDELKEFANARGWLPKSNDELAKNDNDFTRLIEGWTFNDALTSYEAMSTE